MGETAAQSKSGEWAGLLIACAMTGMSLFVMLPHLRSGFVRPGEVLVIGPAVAGCLIGALLAAATGTEMGLVLVCATCISVLGWYSLLVWFFLPEQRRRTSQKVFWGMVTLLTWAPAVILAVGILAGFPVGSSM